MIEFFSGKRCQVFIAHHDDESLYFGGLLTRLFRLTELKITVVTKPLLGRPDTDTRVQSFKKVCEKLGCSYSLGEIQDHPPGSPTDQIEAERSGLLSLIQVEVQEFKPEILLTHNPSGEPTTVYPGGHPVHKLVNESIVKYRGEIEIPIFFNTLGIGPGDFIVSYDRNEKMDLLNFYAPHWNPSIYPFAYKDEQYRRI